MSFSFSLLSLLSLNKQISLCMRVSLFMSLCMWLWTHMCHHSCVRVKGQPQVPSSPPTLFPTMSHFGLFSHELLRLLLPVSTFHCFDGTLTEAVSAHWSYRQTPWNAPLPGLSPQILMLTQQALYPVCCLPTPLWDFSKNFLVVQLCSSGARTPQITWMDIPETNTLAGSS